ncbi:aminoacyl-tRNA hydrolase [Kitasatospora cheerisanensis]|uniref:Peptidyl-tRNA hydrolase n=1 Tax=Kitasatospora cheerisanensis KCTC 2395 TaxID=1348663 RepID=A0A066Z3Y2_9ACTN|nr:aminoacyl-tRNA hydrolase [Kitasatospora cheerisanensis]KDN85056.1 aminoacyl-tRNA hydrolase [Kitasatospora cheerisanensis KCTC 2395]
MGERWLVAGLGNPTRRYAGTRHNAGFLVADRLAERHGARWRGLTTRTASFELDGRTVLLAEPLWSINLSGRPVAALLRRHGVPVERLVVVQDDLDFPFGAARLKRGGGPGGHHGARSVHKALGTADYARLRVGVGRPPKGTRVDHWVVQEFSAEERERMPELLDRCADAVETLVRRGPNRAQDVLHTADAR